MGRKEAIRALPIERIEGILDRSDELLCPEGGHAWKREAGLDRAMTGYVCGVYRYALVDPAGGPSLATEAALGGVYQDPTGTDERTGDGHFDWAIEAHLAVVRAGIARKGRGPLPTLDFPVWADRPALRLGVASSLDQVARLQRAFPERRLRPFTRWWQALPDSLRNNVARAVPVAIDIDPADPATWLESGWRNAASAEALALTTENPPSDGRLRVRTIRDLLSTWALPQDRTSEAVRRTGSILEPGIRGVLTVHSRPELVELVGKEGDDLLASLVDPGATLGGELTSYQSPDTWGPVLDVARRLSTDELAERTGLSRATIYHLLAGGRPSHTTAAIMGVALADIDPREQVGYFWHACARPGCGVKVAGRTRWCSQGCKKAVQRARDALALHTQGARRCRHCDAERFGDLGGPCPVCEDRPRRKSAISVVVCTCGLERVGDLTGPCPLCGRPEVAG